MNREEQVDQIRSLIIKSAINNNEEIERLNEVVYKDESIAFYDSYDLVYSPALAVSLEGTWKVFTNSEQKWIIAKDYNQVTMIATDFFGNKGSRIAEDWVVDAIMRDS